MVAEFEAAFPYTHWRTICFGDTDPAAIVYTARFGDYCMEAAEVWFDRYLGQNWANININEGRGTPVVNMEISFSAPLRANDRLGVQVDVEKLGRSTVTLLMTGMRQGADDPAPVKCFVARFVYCFTEHGRGAVAIPTSVRDKAEQYRSACKNTHKSADACEVNDDE